MICGKFQNFRLIYPRERHIYQNISIYILTFAYKKRQTNSLWVMTGGADKNILIVEY